MDCPRCHTPMREVHHEGLRLDVCPACGSLWLEAAQLHELVVTADGTAIPADQVLAEPELSSTMACPRCDGSPPLYTADLVEIDDIEVDTCRSCRGVFIDAEEIQAIVRTLRWRAADDASAAPRAPLRVQPLLDLVAVVAERYTPESWGRPSWDDDRA